MATDRRKGGMESSRSPRSSKHRHSRSRSRSRDRKRDKKHRRSRSRSKEARRKDSEDRPPKSQKSDEQTERARERLSESGEERHRRKDGKPQRGRSRSRSRSREKHHRSRSRDRKRSRSRSRERRSRSRDRKRRARSRSRSRSKHRHRSRSRSKSRERKKRSEKVRAHSRSRSRSVSPVVFRGRNTAMDAQEALARRLERARKLQEQKEKEMLEMQKQQELVAGLTVPSPLMCDAVATATGSSGLNVAALLASGTQVTPQIAMAAQMAALQAKTLAETGVSVPTFYNPSAVNPMKFAEQEKKRKMLWQGKKEGDKSQTAELWEKLSFGNKDQNLKFRKLMGIKEEEGNTPSLMDNESLKTLKQQEEMFRNLDVQYEMARSQTHTQRGMGLGFSSSFSSRGMDTI